MKTYILFILSVLIFIDSFSQSNECFLYGTVLKGIQKIEDSSNLTYYLADSIQKQPMKVKSIKVKGKMKTILYASETLIPVDTTFDVRMWVAQKAIDSSFFFQNKFFNPDLTLLPRCVNSNNIKIISEDSIIDYSYSLDKGFIFQKLKVMLSNILYTNKMAFIYAVVQTRADDEAKMYGFSFKKNAAGQYAVCRIIKFK